jgi:enoyl-CoA hydratase
MVMTMTYKNILTAKEAVGAKSGKADQPEINIGVVNLHRPTVLNALNHELMEELVTALEDFDRDDSVRAIVLTGSDRAFAAGADIKEMSDETTVSIMLKDRFATWDRIKNIKKPIIAAVSGFALGGGCELMMMCDIIIASETAQFGQPEINLGVIPGAGGTQRMTRVLGKYKAMELILTGRPLTAREALEMGLVNKVAPVELYLEEAKAMAKEIAAKSPIAVKLAKEAVLKSFDGPLQEGLQFERKNFYMLFSSEDQKEGMKAFMEKRKATFTGK